MAENIDININATGNANRVFAQLDKQVSGLNNQFAFLKRAIAGLAVGNFIQNALKMADSIDDVSKATGIASQNVMGFGAAVAANGGTIEDANNALLKFAQTIGEAKDGSKNAITSFNEVGVTLNDLATLSEKDLLKKVIEGLGKITDKSKQARLSLELTGKALKGTDFTGLAKDYDKAVSASARYVESNKAAADAQQNLQIIVAKLSNELLKVLEPVNKFIAGIDSTSETFIRVFNAVKNVVGVLTLIFGVIVPLGRAVMAARASFIAFREALAFLTNKKEGFGRFFTDLKGYFTAIPRISKIISDGLKKAAEGKPSKYTLDEWKNLANLLDTVKTYAAKAALAIGAVVSSVAAGAFGFFGDIESERKPLGRNVRGVQDRIDRDKALDTAAELQNQLNKAYEDGVSKVDAYTKSLQKEFDAISDSINIEREALQIGEKAAEVKRVIQQITDKATDAEERYQEMKRGLDPKNENDKKLIDYINAQVAAINRKAEAAKKAGKEAVEALQKERAAYEEVLFQIEQYNTKLDNEEALRQIREEGELIGLVGKELEKKRQQIELERRERAALLVLQKEENKLIEEYNKLTAEGQVAEAEAYNRNRQRIEERRQGVKDQYKAEREELDKNKAKQESMMDDFLKGIRDRLKVIKEDESLYNLGDKLAQSLENAIDEFVKTGKFKFKEFAASALREWLAMKAKMALMDVFDGLLSKVKDIFGAMSGVGGGGGGGSKGFLSGFFGNLLKSFLPGFADGGVPPMNKPSLVGERGPELFVPRQTGTVVPSEMLAAMSRPAAPVTNNYITNNINALDAKSVAQLFAENRKSLLGSVRTAEKELPYRA